MKFVLRTLCTSVHSATEVAYIRELVMLFWVFYPFIQSNPSEVSSSVIVLFNLILRLNSANLLSASVMLGNLLY